MALDLVMRKPYDLVLMDMQMPVMDGMECAARMRAAKELAGLPIVAMTANAMSRDRDRCLEAGMNDFVSKPISPPELFAVVRKWARRPPAAGAAGGAAAQAVRHAGSDLGLLCPVEGLDIPEGLSRMMGKKPLYLAMLRRYLHGQRDCASQLQQAIDTGDWTAAGLLVHTNRGLSGTIGAARVGEAAAALELAIQGRGLRPDIDQRREQFENALRELLAGLELALP